MPISSLTRQKDRKPETDSISKELGAGLHLVSAHPSRTSLAEDGSMSPHNLLIPRRKAEFQPHTDNGL